jgi:hypothetical protein
MLPLMLALIVLTVVLFDLSPEKARRRDDDPSVSLWQCAGKKATDAVAKLASTDEI